MTWTPLHSQLHQTIRQRWPHLRGASVLVAVSGGQDSLCLLQLLWDLQKHWGWQLGVAHCDHGWPTDVGMADHVAMVAKGYELPYFQADTKNLPQTEAAARHWRYQALTAIASEAEFRYVMTGHTQTDRAETLLFNLLRGSGSDGLQALGWERALSPTVILLRPLLGIRRQQTGAFCQQFALPVWEDELNQTVRYQRNRIRHELVPYLQSHFNPQVEKSLAQTMEILTAEVDYLEQISNTLYQQVITAAGDGLNRRLLRSHPLALQRRVIRQFLQHCQPHAPSFEHIEAVASLLSAPNRSQTSTLGGNWVMRVEGDWLYHRTLPSQKIPKRLNPSDHGPSDKAKN